MLTHLMSHIIYFDYDLQRTIIKCLSNKLLCSQYDFHDIIEQTKMRNVKNKYVTVFQICISRYFIVSSL